MAEQLLPLLQEVDLESLDRVKRSIDQRQVRHIVRFFFGIRRHHFLTHVNFERGCTLMASLLTNDTKDCKKGRQRARTCAAIYAVSNSDYSRRNISATRIYSRRDRPQEDRLLLCV